MNDDRRDWACWALRNRERLSGLSPAQWEPVIRHGRRADVLARIAAQLQHDGQINAVPVAPRAHLLAALRVWRAQMQEVAHEAGLIAEALQALNVPVVMLKGAAYVLSNQPSAQGRVFSDIDILVPRSALNEVEGALRHGELVVLGTSPTSHPRHAGVVDHEIVGAAVMSGVHVFPVASMSARLGRSARADVGPMVRNRHNRRGPLAEVELSEAVQRSLQKMLDEFGGTYTGVAPIDWLGEG